MKYFKFYRNFHEKYIFIEDLLKILFLKKISWEIYFYRKFPRNCISIKNYFRKCISSECFIFINSGDFYFYRKCSRNYIIENFL